MDQTDEDICPRHTCMFMTLLPFFLDLPIEQTEVSIPPSRLLIELQMPLQDRIDQLCKPTRKRRVRTDVNTFARTPDIMVFQNFDQFKQYKTTITFLNIKSTSRNLKISGINSPYFDVVQPGLEYDYIKVAPGVNFVITIIFKPTDIRDYFTELVCTTNEETFIFPVYAIGHRPLLHLPDEIHINPTALKVTSEKSVLLHNYGKIKAFYVTSISEPFTVAPAKGCLQPNEVVELDIQCTPTKNTNFIRNDLIIHCDDLEVKVPVTCMLQSAEVYFIQTSVEFLEIFVGLQYNKTITLCNKSPFTLQFQWKKYATDLQEIEQRQRFVGYVKHIVDMEKRKSNKLEYMDTIDHEGHKNICTKKLENNIEEDIEFLYKSEVFSILPMTGKLFPHQSMDFMVIFFPTANEVYLSTAYLDITGRSERLAVNLSGIGKGPTVIFNVTKLDIGSIFLEVTHEYQVVVKNDGCIPATVVFKPKETEFGGKITCSPPFQYLSKIDSCRSFVIKFSSPYQGQFVEKVEFEIRESKEIINFLLVGNVVCPVLRTNIPMLDFGELSYGNVQTMEIQLFNDSQVPIDYNISISNRACNTDNTCEFDIEPRSGIVEAYGVKTVKIKLTANLLDEIGERMIVMMYGSEMYQLAVPMKYKCGVPEVTTDPSEILINFCFINYDYTRVIKFINDTNLCGHLFYTPLSEPRGMKVSLDKTDFMICPGDIVELTLTICTYVPGLHEYPLMFTMSGEDKPKMMCKIKCNGQGPVVSYIPDELNFGNVTLLTTKIKKLRLLNDSPIPAVIKIKIEPPGAIKLSHYNFEIPPEDEQIIETEIYLKDNVKIASQLLLNIEHGEQLSVNIFAEGVGYSILCEPILQPEYSFGAQLTHRVAKILINLTNLGRKYYRLFWTQKPLVKTFKELEDLEKLIDKKSVFEIKPNYLELAHNQSNFIEISCLSKKPTVVEEVFYCYAQLDKTVRVHTVFTVLFQVKFVEPNLKFTTKNLNFLEMHVPNISNESLCCLTYNEEGDLNIDKPNLDHKSVMNGEVTVTNESEIPLHLRIHASSEFFIMDEDEPMKCIEYTLDIEENLNIVVSFRPVVEDKVYRKHCGKLTINIEDYPHPEILSLIGEVCFPTIKFEPEKLDFGCIPIDSSTCRYVVLENITFLPVDFTWEIDMDSFLITKLDEPEAAAEPSPFLPKNKTPPSAENRKTIYNSVKPTLDLEQIKPVQSKNMKIFSEDTTVQVQSKKSFASQESSLQHSSYSQLDKIEERAKNILQEVFCAKYDEEYIEFWKEKKYMPVAPDSLNLRDIITIEPWKGCLRPYEHGLISIYFSPPPNVIINCICICKINGGEELEFEISGSCSHLSFKFNKSSIYVGNRLFCEILEESLILTNTGHYDFCFQVDCDSLEIFQDKKLKSKWLNIFPDKGYLEAGKEIPITIRYFPGIVGNINELILFEMDHLDTVTIPMVGSAVFSQVALSLPRSEMNKSHQEINYIAIAQITDQYLKTLQSNRESLVKDELNEHKYKLLEAKGWVVVRYDDSYPSNVEIDLAIERMFINDYLRNNYNRLRYHCVTRKYKLIPNFKVPHYKLDFGHVVVDRPVCFTVLIINYGPEPTTVHKMKSNLSSLSNNQMFVEYKNKTLGVGEIGELYVVFKPRKEYKIFDDRYVQDYLFLGVNHGAMIPIIITATISLPRFRFHKKCLDFGAVKVGNVLKKSVVIENLGYLTCKWNADVQSTNTMKNAFYIIPQQGQLIEMDKGLMDIFFMPIKNGCYISEVEVYIEGSVTRYVLELIGHGMIPNLALQEKHMKFESSVPYAERIVKPLLIQNVSTFPIEYSFSDFDETYDKEKMLIDLFMEYHNLKILFIPERLPGTPLLNIFENTYNTLLNELKKSGVSEKDIDTENLENMSKGEIVGIIRERIKEWSPTIDNNTTDMQEFENKSLEGLGIITTNVSSIVPEIKHGVIIVFHGSPNTEYYKAANHISKTLGMKMVSIDQLIFEELLHNQSEHASEINKKINEMIDKYVVPESEPLDDEYDELAKKVEALLDGKKIGKKSKDKTSGKGDKQKGNKNERSKSADDVKSKASNKSNGDKSSTKASKSSKSTKSGKTARGNSGSTFLDIHPQTFANLLKGKLEKMKPTIVIESLNSIFLANPLLAMEVLLHGIGNLNCIIFIFLSLTLEDYINNETEIRYKKHLDEMMAREKRKNHLDTKHSREKSRPESSKSRINKVGKNRKTKSADNIRDKGAGDNEEPSERKKKPGSAISKEKLLDGSLSAISKRVAKEIPKYLEREFALSNTLLLDICEFAEHWDRRHGVILKTSSLFAPVKSKHKRKKGSISKTERYGETSVSRLKVTESALTNSRVIYPGEIVKYEVSFMPKYFGEFEHKYRIEIMGYSKSLFVKCHAICELPSVDYNPESMFEKCLTNLNEKNVNDNFVYSRQDMVFDFGPILQTSSKMPSYEVDMSLKNTSNMMCKINVEVEDNSPFHVIALSTEVPPDEKAEVKLTCQGGHKGAVEGLAYITISKNPVVFTLPLTARVCPLEFNVNPKSLIFEKVPLNYSVKRIVKLTNSSPIGLKWVLHYSAQLKNVYKLSKDEGMIRFYSTDKFEVEYCPNVEEMNPKTNLNLNVYDLNCSDTVPFLTETISLQSDSVEYILHYNEHIDLGEVKGKIEYKIPLQLTNNSKTFVKLEVDKINHPPEKQLEKISSFFTLNAESETLQPQKSSALQFIFHPSEEFLLEDVPLYICKFLDLNQPDGVFKSFEIRFSVIVHLSKFSLYPETDIYFGIIDLTHDRMQLLKISNIGKCPFKYAILSTKPRRTSSKKKLRSDSALQNSARSGKSTSRSDKTDNTKQSKESKDTKVSKKSRDSRKSKDSLRKSAKAKETVLNVGEFTIISSTGSVEPGTTAEVEVTYKPSYAGLHEEVIYIIVSEPAKGFHKERTVTLHAEGAEPKLIFDDYQKMFKELYIVQNVGEIPSTTNIGTYSYYNISKNTLNFDNVCVNTIQTAKIYLHNIGKVAAQTTLKVTDGKCFGVSPLVARIEAYSVSPITVTFKPDSINMFEGKLEIRYNGRNTNFFVLGLSGRSCIPQVQITNIEAEDHVHKIIFSPTYPEEWQFKKVIIKNTGMISCTIIISLCIENNDSHFFIMHTEEVPDLSNHDIEKQLSISSVNISLCPSESTSIFVFFKSMSPIMAEGEVKIFIVNNPYETKKLELYGQCYGGEITVHDIPASNPSEWNINQNEIIYHLDFGYSPLRIINKKYFSIKNKSKTCTYRFNFRSDVPNLFFLPSIGHLKPSSRKEILVMVSSKEPKTLHKIPIQMDYTSISFVESSDNDMGWDNRQSIFSYVETNDKLSINESEIIDDHYKNCMEAAIESFSQKNIGEDMEAVKEQIKTALDVKEPNIIINSEQLLFVNFLVSFTSDFASYSCETKELIFPDTYVNNKSNLSFEVLNGGLVPLNLEWILACVNTLSKNNTTVGENEVTLKNCQDNSSEQGLRMKPFVKQNYDHPFQIIPRKTEIQPSTSTVFQIIFTPAVASQYYYKLKSKISSLHPDLKNIELSITGQSLLPDYYFELKDSDHGKHEGAGKCSKINEENMKVIEIHATGIGETKSKSFILVNTSGDSLSYKLEPIRDINTLSYFHCPTSCGIIENEKKCQLSFCFTPQQIGTFEEEYLFNVKEKESETYFLVVGNCTNPKVYFNTAHLCLKPTLLSVPCDDKIYLRNDEEDELWYKIVKSSLVSQDCLQKLKIFPTSGSIIPNTDLEMQITYNAELVGDATFYIQCEVQKMTKPLTLTISAKCQQIECKVYYLNKAGEEILLDHNIENIIDLGKIGIKTKSILLFSIVNDGITGFFYNWIIKNNNTECLVNVTAKTDKEFVACGTTVTTELLIKTGKKYNLSNFPIKLLIPYGPTYNIKLSLSAEFAVCSFSFTNYDFGNCVVQQGVRQYYEVQLEIKNREPQPVKLENLFPENENLTVDFKQIKIAANCVKKIPIYFHPRSEGSNEFKVPISLNCMRKVVKITGCGVKVNMQLLKPQDAFIDMGKTKLGDTSTYSMFVINKTPCQVEAKIILSDEDLPPIDIGPVESMKPEIVVPDVPPPTEREARKKGTTSTLSVKDKSKKDINKKGNKSTKKDDRAPNDNLAVIPKPIPSNECENFHIYPSKPVRIDSNKKYEFIVEFKPVDRKENYSTKIYYKIFDYIGLLSSIKGRCVVPEFSLDQNLLTFCNVLVGHERTNTLLLRNTGDFGIKFRWTHEELTHFKIIPTEGYLAANSKLQIMFTFKCDSVGQIIRKCKCLVDNKHILELSLVANTIDLPEPRETIQFFCPVREKCTQHVSLTNSNKLHWRIKPTVSNSIFTVPAEILLEPNSTASIPVDYYPKRMTTLDSNDTGLLILPLDDKEIIYALVGTAVAPLPEKKIWIEIRAKYNHSQILQIRNWTNAKICCQVETVLKSIPTLKTLYKVSGLETVELRPNEVKGYEWNVYIINEEVLDFNVIFKDQDTEEYLFYDITVKVLPPVQKPTKELETCVRHAIKTSIKLENPINISVVFNLNGGSAELHYERFFNMQPYTKVDLEVLYLPTKPGVSTPIIDANCNELGSISYPFKLIARPPPKEKPVKFVAELGFACFEKAVIQNTFSSSLELNATFAHAEFSMERTTTILPGETGTIRIKFEPSSLGVTESELTLTSSVSGAYVFPLFGKCTLPTPKGPFIIKRSSSTPISFFNPFTYSETFYYDIDNKMFHAKLESEEVRGRQSTKIIVTHPNNKSDLDVTYPVTGKLTVTRKNKEVDEQKETVKWSFYLQSDK
ncbi:hydrocephalus-inducing protein homolog isoform X2 [Diabrotica undecimpunctata]|uniref:hydrocephalus-inducing protein homolog isoform X2 n=1 Tax=Diabrotica undecimpunctata TaxID=50387 RepID=UPI003B6320DB